MDQNESKVFFDLHDYMTIATVEKSEVLYLEVLDAIADSKDTLIHVLHDLFTVY